MNQINNTKDDIVKYKNELVTLLELVGTEASYDFKDFLEQNIKIAGRILRKIEAGDYSPYVKLALKFPVVFQYLADQRRTLQVSLQRYENCKVGQNTDLRKQIFRELIRSKIFVINNKCDELAEPLKDDALFEILLKGFKAVQDYKTNTVGITVKEDTLSNGSHIADKVYLQLSGFKEAYLWFHIKSDYPQLIAVDENGNKIYMGIDAAHDSFSCEIVNEDSHRDQTSGWLGSHLRNPGGYEKISQILSNLKTAMNNLAIQRHPDMANEVPLTFEQREIIKTNIFRYQPMKNISVELEYWQAKAQETAHKL